VVSTGFSEAFEGLKSKRITFFRKFLPVLRLFGNILEISHPLEDLWK
jgi:hypothetical protein